MEKVVGIGGIFLKAKDPAGLRKWYADHLGVPDSEWGCVFEATGQTVWSLFPDTTEYFLPSHKEFMINYRVENLDAMLKQLTEAGVPVEEITGDLEYGRFGHATDPEGNRFELWQPPAA